MTERKREFEKREREERIRKKIVPAAYDMMIAYVGQ